MREPPYADALDTGFILHQERLVAMLSGFFGALALLLAGVAGLEDKMQVAAHY
jgi:hypothetical protein